MPKSIMIQGTGSNVGKSLLVAGLARALTRRGLAVRPFKPQNMSNNAAVTADGGEIGRAQALQARAAGVEPVCDMNPVLLKPESDTGSQVILCGKRIGTAKAQEYGSLKRTLLEPTFDAFNRLREQADIVLVEGAGSPAEINLREGDIANMGFAQAANVPVILAGDIDRGGVIAQIVGTKCVLSPSDADLIKGFLVNRFRGDPELFANGMAQIVDRTRWPSLGLVPWYADAQLLPAEDALDLRKNTDGRIHIAIPQLSRIANFDDFDPLAAEPDIALSIVPPGKALPGDASLVILPGSKSTIGDLAFFRAQGWDIDLAAHVRRGGHVLGICGGYQMLGKKIRDPDGIEGPAGSVNGLGYLDVETTMTSEKTLTHISGSAFGAPIGGYEIHIGQTTGPDCEHAWADMGGPTASAASSDRRILGIYAHGIFTSDEFRAAYLGSIGAEAGKTDYDASVENALDGLAEHLENHLDLDRCLEIAAAGV